MSNSPRIISLSKSPGYTLPKVSELQRRPWIQIGIEDVDDFFDTLIQYYTTSPTNKSAVDGCHTLLYGKGVKDKNPLLEEYLYTLTEVEELSRIFFDYKLFGNAAIQIIFSPDRKRILKFYHIPVNSLRAEKVAECGDIKAYYYSSDWENKKIKPTRIPVFGCEEYEDDVQIYYIKKYNPNNYYYAIPDYYAGIQYSQVEEEIANLHINNILNNFMPSTLINFNGGIPPEEEKDKIELSIANKYAGSTNAGKFIVSFNENVESKATIDSIRSENLHENYNFISREAQDKILLSHRVTSQLLFGIKNASGFSSNAEELKTSYDVFLTYVIAPMQNELLKVIKKLMEYNGYLNTDLYIDQLVPAVLQADLQQSVGKAEAKQIIQDTNNQADNVISEQNVPK